MKTENDMNSDGHITQERDWWEDVYQPLSVKVKEDSNDANSQTIPCVSITGLEKIVLHQCHEQSILLRVLIMEIIHINMHYLGAYWMQMFSDS